MGELRGLMMFQVPVSDPLSGHDVHLLMIGVVIIAVALVLQAVGVIAAGVFAMKILTKVESLTDMVEKRAMPIVDKVNVIVTDLQPKIQSVSTNVEEISYTVRAKTDEIGATVTSIKETVDDINAKTRVHVDHADRMVTNALNTTHEVSEKVQRGIKAPINQVAGLFAGLKAGVETLAERSPFGKKKTVPNPYDL